MKEQETTSQVQTDTAPHQVWATLSAVQQKTIFQTIVHICQNLAAQWKQEEKNANS